MKNLQCGPESWDSISNSAPAIEHDLHFVLRNGGLGICPAGGGGDSFHFATEQEELHVEDCQLLSGRMEFYTFSLRVCIAPECFKGSLED